jgi:1,6-anhydro-N-acetylmuramate kinase
VPVLAIGLMSGTSQDVVDVALIETDGDVITRFGRTAYRSYSKDERALLRSATAAAENARNTSMIATTPVACAAPVSRLSMRMSMRVFCAAAAGLARSAPGATLGPKDDLVTGPKCRPAV